MTVDVQPYLEILRAQLETALWPPEDSGAQKLSLFTHRVLTQLILQRQLMPKLQEQALSAYASHLDAMLDSLAAHPQQAQALENTIRSQPDYEQATQAMQKAIPLWLASGQPRERELLRAVADIEHALQLALEEAARSREMTPPDHNERHHSLSPAQVASLQAYLRKAFPDAPELLIAGLRPIPGGFSKHTTFLMLENQGSLPATVVLRADRADSPVGTTVVDEFELIRTLHEAGVAVPRPLLVEADPACVGGPFLIVEKIDGENIGDALEIAQPSREFGCSLARGMAKLHAVDPASVGSRIPGAGVSTRERMLGDITQFEGLWRSLNQASVAMELAFGWLKANLDQAEGKRAVVHRDIGCHNLLVKDQRLAVLLDWETAVIGNPAQDLAYVYHSAIQLMPWSEFVAEYEAAGGSAPSQQSLDFYRVWRAVWVMTYQMVARSFVVSGQSQDIAMAYASQYLFQRLNYGLHDLMRQVIGDLPQR